MLDPVTEERATADAASSVRLERIVAGVPARQHTRGA